MRVVWVQHWSYLPVILEDIDVNDARQSGTRSQIPVPADPAVQLVRSRANTESQISSAQAPIHQIFAAGNAIPNMPGQPPAAYGQGRGPASNALSMSGLSDALPEYQQIPPSQSPPDEADQSFSGSIASLGHQTPSPFASQTSLHNPAYGALPPQYSVPYQQGPGSVQPYSHMQLNPSSYPSAQNPIQPSYSNSPFYTNQQQQQQQQQQHSYSFYPAHYPQAGQPQQGLPAPYAQAYGRGSAQMLGLGHLPQPVTDTALLGGRPPQYGSISPGGPIAYNYGHGAPLSRSGISPVVKGGHSPKPAPGPIPSSPRGPPRKPKQSGHALWVGNLPSGTQVTTLKDYFSREATKSIESVFLISKSNCAFVNYRTDEACAAAMNRFHDSRFQGVRLVCRLRRSSTTPTTGVPTGPAALMPTMTSSQTAIESIRQNREISSRAEAMSKAESSGESQAGEKAADKYFIMKSLTVEDMELSVRNCIWATQAHNEDALNKAFETSENVYLIFSANKSGEYFGYARMASLISEDVAAGLDWAPKPDAVIDDPDVPRAIPTQPTEWAPRGRIIDDSARGTIFWEADPEEADEAPQDEEELDQQGDVEPSGVAEESDEPAPQSGDQAFGKPFKIEWLSTTRLPFYRTRGLRNPWNANREIKIARDGTELETSVGRKLLQMFHRAVPEPTAVQTGWPIARPY